MPNRKVYNYFKHIVKFVKIACQIFASLDSLLHSKLSTAYFVFSSYVIKISIVGIIYSHLPCAQK